jgi:NADPH:quinone reductase
LDHDGNIAVDPLRIGELADPAPSPDEVLVRVRAASLNPVDFKVAAVGSELWSYPHVLGVDAAGVIEQVGVNVTDWRLGDRVLYHTTWRRHGTYAELSTVPGHTIAKVPESVSYVDAAAIPCAGLTAYNSLYRRLHCKSGDLILIHGGSGGVGGFAIQLAKQLGATVVTTCSAANADYVRDLGAEEVIDHRTENVFERARQIAGPRLFVFERHCSVVSFLDLYVSRNAHPDPLQLGSGNPLFPFLKR